MMKKNKNNEKLNDKEWLSAKIEIRLKNKLRDDAKLHDISLNKAVKWALQQFLGDLNNG